MTDKSILEKLVTKIQNAYHAREDYPPFKLDPMTDRLVYHQYILTLIREEIEAEGNQK